MSGLLIAAYPWIKALHIGAVVAGMGDGAICRTSSFIAGANKRPQTQGDGRSAQA
jgi:hypothetical protein